MDSITYEDFTKLDIRVGTIIKAEEVPKSKKLVKLEVSFGAEIGSRTIMAGIVSMVKDQPVVFEGSSTDVESFFVGQRVVAVVNLAPRSMMGVESHGMLLASHRVDEAGKDHIKLVQCHDVDDGAQVG